ncbi:PTS modulated transcriptional regulator, MtlR family [Thermoanaerobacterium xylanolyticum LX-11]|uniref:PTS modulated transcriptional regulator, MtlR family n=1 Tax=Thermoanaerobacterium xylanolyticum (strain ATCC 49914 / DSM 7097 / LX-11) TaxID=858215 RepID=F6BIM7_THEXL|nr:PRD domain-containing protein [Thermoanaerobacterium xylanolyticum]AEF16771.1 PTS modulated transcriptional regulator, MtlR family [Thermoanaerobacterium xylanolyticum LX-11]
MKELSRRQLEIFKKVLSKEVSSLDDIVILYKLSKRTVYREINTINEYIKEYNLRLKNDGGALVLEGTDNDIEKFKFDVIGYRPSIDADKRRKLILSELLQMKEPVKLEYFAKEYNVTTATISYDIKEIDKWLNKQNVTIVTKPGVGIYVKGDENNIRRAIINFLYDNVETKDLIEFLNKGYNNINKLSEDINDRLLRLIDYDTVLKIEKAIQKLEKSLNYELAESSYMGLTVHLALALKRIKEGEKIKIGNESLYELKKSDEFEFAEMLARFLEEEFDISIPEDEIGYITIHLQGARYRANTEDVNDELLNEILQEMISVAEDEFGTDFKDDMMLLSGLKTHLRPTIFRLRMGLAIRNPLINDIKERYSSLFEKCISIANVIKDKLNVDVPDDEIGYIAMHFGASIARKSDMTKRHNILVVCASGIGTSRMLLSKLQMFPQLNIVDTVSSLRVKDFKDRDDIDLIVSTIPLDIKGKETVIVNPLLLDEDVKKLKDALNTDFIMDFSEKKVKVIGDRYKELEHIAWYGKRIIELCDSLKLKDVYGKNSKAIIDSLLEDFAGNDGINNEKIKQIEDKLLGRESLGKIILPGKGFVIYHCTASDLVEPILVFGKLRSDVKMKNLINEYEIIKTAFLMVAPDGDKMWIEILGDLSVSFIESKDLVKNLNEVDKIDEAKEIVKKALMDKYYDEIKRNLVGD